MLLAAAADLLCRYFYIPARKEHRGIGGLFFDDLSSSEVPYDAEAFTRDVGRGMLASWRPIAERRRGAAYTEAHRNWQLLRRGRCGVHPTPIP